jgi:hypothetical protein
MVRHSLAIERLGPMPEHGGLDRLSGPGEVIVQRAIELEPAEVLRRLDDLLVGQHQLRRERTWPSAMQWRKRTDALGFIQRTVRNFSGQAPLGKAASITANVSPVEEQQSIVRVTLDREGQRSGAMAGGAAVGTVGIAGIAVLAAVASPLLLIASPVALVAGLSVSAHGRRQADEAARQLECLLDGVEQDAKPATLTRAMRHVTRTARRQDRRDSWL